jgi:hypothetical protein
MLNLKGNFDGFDDDLSVSSMEYRVIASSFCNSQNVRTSSIKMVSCSCQKLVERLVNANDTLGIIVA